MRVHLIRYGRLPSLFVAFAVSWDAETHAHSTHAPCPRAPSPSPPYLLGLVNVHLYQRGHLQAEGHRAGAALLAHVYTRRSDTRHGRSRRSRACAHAWLSPPYPPPAVTHPESRPSSACTLIAASVPLPASPPLPPTPAVSSFPFLLSSQPQCAPYLMELEQPPLAGLAWFRLVLGWYLQAPPRD